MRWGRALAGAVGILALWAGAAWGQLGGASFSLLRVGVEVSFFTIDVPQLTISALFQRPGWQLGLQADSPLIELSSWQWSLTQQIQVGAVQLELSSREGESELKVFAQAQTSYGKANLRLQASSSHDLSLTLSGALAWDVLSVEMEQLEYADGTWRMPKKAALNWSFSPELSIGLSADAKEGLGPLKVKFQRELEKGLMLGFTGSFDVRGERLRPSGWEGTLRRGDVGVGLLLHASGLWRQLWLQARHSWEPMSLSETLYVGPEGFQAFQLKGGLTRWPTEGIESTGTLEIKPQGWALVLKPQLTFGWASSLEAEVKVDSASSWESHLKGQWIELFGSVQGELKWGQAGFSDTQLSGNVLLGDVMFQGSFICSGVCDGENWLATLLGSVSQGPWELSGQLDFAPPGWQSANVGVNRIFFF